MTDHFQCAIPYIHTLTETSYCCRLWQTGDQCPCRIKWVLPPSLVSVIVSSEYLLVLQLLLPPICPEAVQLDGAEQCECSETSTVLGCSHGYTLVSPGVFRDGYLWLVCEGQERGSSVTQQTQHLFTKLQGLSLVPAAISRQFYYLDIAGSSTSHFKLAYQNTTAKDQVLALAAYSSFFLVAVSLLNL